MVHVREARPEDDERIGEILVDAFVTAYGRKMPEVVVTDERKRELRDTAAKRRASTVLVAEVDGRVVGTVMVLKPGAEGSEAWLPGHADLRHLATDVSAHGKGYSTPLLDRAEAIVRDEWSAPGICLHVRRGARGVAELYMKRGYAREPSGDMELPSVFLEGYLLSFRG